jgi:tRNA-specific 2-thiouridylase
MELCEQHCPDDARAIAQKLEIPFHVFDFTAEFRKRVIDRFVQTYLEGRTPNPCIDCNRFLKFDLLLRAANSISHKGTKVTKDSFSLTSCPLCLCEKKIIATGHYAQIEYDSASGRYLLKKAVDETKDQSYVLYTMTQSQLAQTMFPLGTLRKEEVRIIAESLGFTNAEKRDSQDLCFVPDGDYASFIERYTGRSCPAGDFVDRTGKVLGKHKGLIHYTIGQRKGLGIAAPAPYYVCEHNVKDNTVILGSESDLLVQTLTATDINLIPFDRIENSIRALVKVRYRQKGDWATVRQIDSDTLQIVFDEPQKAVAKGQAAVLYDGDYVIGGGTIVAAF